MGNVGNVSCMNPRMLRRCGKLGAISCFVWWRSRCLVWRPLYPPSQVLDASKSRYCWVRDGSVYYSMVMKPNSPEKLVSVVGKL